MKGLQAAFSSSNELLQHLRIYVAAPDSQLLVDREGESGLHQAATANTCVTESMRGHLSPGCERPRRPRGPGVWHQPRTYASHCTASVLESLSARGAFAPFPRELSKPPSVA